MGRMLLANRILRSLLASGVLLGLLPPCAANADPLREARPPTQFCDMGVFSVGGSYYSFRDIQVEGLDAINLNEKWTIVVYGYIEDIHLPDDMLSSSVRAWITSGQKCAPYQDTWVVGPSEPFIDLVIDPQAFNYDKTRIKEVRKMLASSNDSTVNVLSLVMFKLEGQFSMYSDKDKLFFSANSIEIVGDNKSFQK